MLGALRWRWVSGGQAMSELDARLPSRRRCLNLADNRVAGERAIRLASHSRRNTLSYSARSPLSIASPRPRRYDSYSDTRAWRVDKFRRFAGPANASRPLLYLHAGNPRVARRRAITGLSRAMTGWFA